MLLKNLTLFLSLGICILLFSECSKTSITSPAPTPPTSNQSLDDITPIVTDANFYSVTGNDSTSAKGEILMALNSKTDGKLFFLDQRGSVIREVSVGTDVENLQKWNINGQVRYTYFHSEGTSTLDGTTGTELGYEMVCDSNLNILDSVKLLSFGSIDANQQDKLDVHEFILLADKHYIYETYYEEFPNNIPDSLHPASGVKVAACIIQEVLNGEVVFQWDGTQYPELYSASQENNNFGDSTTLLDYMHLNSICVDSLDNNLIVSFRNLNEIVKLNRQTGQIIWRLGGNHSDFNLSTDQVFLRQHYPRLIENGKTLIFLDNGHDSLRPYSRIVEFQLNQSNKTINSFKSFTIPDNFIQFAGSVKKEGNEYFIGGGSADYSLQVDYTTGQELMRMSLKYSSYRSLKY
ncbi:MAG TPA: aryl-sulfate sulfotransferase [Puia sp.]|nr:aryl-sulfate sulfotransferase [Puia sp.]